MTRKVRRRKIKEITVIDEGITCMGGEMTKRMESEDEFAVENFLAQELRQLEKISNIAEHRIVKKDEIPLKHRYMLSNPAKRQIISELVDELLENNCIEPSHSPIQLTNRISTKEKCEMEVMLQFSTLE